MSVRPLVVDADLQHPGEASIEQAARRFVGTEVLDPDSAAFAEAHGVMDRFFGPRNEIERVDVLRRWLREPLDTGRIGVTYHLAAWHDRETGALAGARDCFVGLDREARRCVVLLSHSFVLPEWRRSGVAALIRTAPVQLARQAVGDAPILLVAEMELVVPTDDSSIVRHLSYGRAGFGAIPPEILPYCQPDFRDLQGAPAEPIPMPCVVRLVGREDERRVPTAHVDALVEILALLHLRACEPTHVEALAASDRAGLRRYGLDEVPLLPLPTRLDELERLLPLTRSRALPHYPARYRVPVDPDEDLRGLQQAARRLGGAR